MVVFVGFCGVEGKVWFVECEEVLWGDGGGLVGVMGVVLGIVLGVGESGEKMFF